MSAQFSFRVRKANITEPVVMFKLAKSYRKDITPEELYWVTRGQWKMNMDKALEVEYAFACDKGNVVEVYEIENWHQAGTTMSDEEKIHRNSKGLQVGEENRIEFTGKIANEKIRRKYLNTSVVEYWGRSQTPFKYVNCSQ